MAPSDGTSLHGTQHTPMGNDYDADASAEPVAMDVYPSSPTSAPSAWASTMNPSAPPFAPWTAAWTTPTTARLREQLLAKKEFMHLLRPGGWKWLEVETCSCVQHFQRSAFPSVLPGALAFPNAALPGPDRPGVVLPACGRRGKAWERWSPGAGRAPC